MRMESFARVHAFALASRERELPDSAWKRGAHAPGSPLGEWFSIKIDRAAAILHTTTAPHGRPHLGRAMNVANVPPLPGSAQALAHLALSQGDRPARSAGIQFAASS